MQNNFLKLILFTLINKFVNASYIGLILFLSISFKYYFIFYFFVRIVFFINILFFNFWEKVDVEIEIVGENFRKREMWKRNCKRKFWEKRKQVREIIKKMKWLLQKCHYMYFFFFFFIFLLLQCKGYFTNLRSHFRLKLSFGSSIRNALPQKKGYM